MMLFVLSLPFALYIVVVVVVVVVRCCTLLYVVVRCCTLLYVVVVVVVVVVADHLVFNYIVFPTEVSSTSPFQTCGLLSHWPDHKHPSSRFFGS